MNRHHQTLKAVANANRCELWWDRNLQLWTLLDVDKCQCCGHYYPSWRLNEMSMHDMISECKDLLSMTS